MPGTAYFSHLRKDCGIRTKLKKCLKTSEKSCITLVCNVIIIPEEKEK
jgi:hypothetical protein